MIDRLRPHARPFRGPDVRRMVAMMTLAVAIPRLPIWANAPAFSPLRLLPPEAFGWLCLAVGLSLLVTGGRWRVRLRGRLAALGALVVWALLTGATNSATSLLIDLVIMWALLGEIGAGRDDC
jgi:hypothetical protein